MNCCKYKNSLGIPGKGVHVHYMGIAYNDVFGTIIIGVLLHYIFYPKINLWFIIIVLFLLGIYLHRLFCVQTTLDKYLFPNAQ